MRFFTGIILYLCIIFSFLQNVVFLTVVAVVLFSVRYGAVMLIPVAILIDGYFGNFYGVPLLSIGSIVWYMLIEYMRLKLLSPTLL